METGVQAQSVRDAIGSVRGPYMRWMMAVLDSAIAEGNEPKAAKFGGLTAPFLGVMDDYLDSLPGEPEAVVSADQVFVAGLLTGALSAAYGTRIVDASGKIEARRDAPLPQGNPIADAVAEMRAVLESIQL